MQVIESNEGEAGVIYCMRRADVDSLAAELQRKKVKAQPYHAGMSMEQRRRVQEEFASEKCDIVVATIAFGMGIDRSNVRFVIHTAMPKSLESYQQETGRAGRDGLPASCVLLYSGADVVVAKKMLQKTAEEGGSQAHLPIVLKHLDEMDRYARGAICRHKALVNHFGQEYELPSCGACDICLGDCEQVKDAIVVAQKILSCVARVKSGFGIMHVISILRGKATENVRKRGHETLKTFGILSDQSEDNLRDWIYQLIGQNVLVQTEDEYPKLQLNEASWEVMRNQREVKLVQLKRRKKGDKKTKTFIEPESLTGEDQKIFDDMRQLRKKLATERQIPPYVVFADMVLREMIRHKPDSLAAMRLISGVGDQKLRDYGQAFLEVIQEHCRNHRGPHTMSGEEDEEEEKVF
jgi:ATP-dependent DNA helicase RecQ